MKFIFLIGIVFILGTCSFQFPTAPNTLEKCQQIADQIYKYRGNYCGVQTDKDKLYAYCKDVNYIDGDIEPCLQKIKELPCQVWREHIQSDAVGDIIPECYIYVKL